MGEEGGYQPMSFGGEKNVSKGNKKKREIVKKRNQGLEKKFSGNLKGKVISFKSGQESRQKGP
jgi:hypothetical protein